MRLGVGDGRERRKVGADWEVTWMDIIVVAVKGAMVRMVMKRIMVTSMFAEDGEQLSGRRNFALGLIRDGTDLSW